MLLFCPVEFFLRIFHTSYAYVKFLLESKITSGINQSSTQHLEIIIRQEKVIFVDFKKMIHRKKPRVNSAVKRSFFKTQTRLLFWLVKFFLRIFYASYAYVKCLLESEVTFGINQSSTRHLEIIIRQERVIFVDFEKMIPRKKP